jgi:hypothetical protein
VRALQAFGMPFGMAEVVEEQDRCVGFRIFILDNSGSTDVHDGCSYAVDHRGEVRPRTCTRWEEIKVSTTSPLSRQRECVDPPWWAHTGGGNAPCLQTAHMTM